MEFQVSRGILVSLIFSVTSVAFAERPSWVDAYFDDLVNKQCRLVRLTVSRCLPHRAAVSARQSTKMEGLFSCGGTDFRLVTMYRATADENEASCGSEVRESCRVEYAANDEPRAERLVRMYTEGGENLLDLLWSLISEKTFHPCQAKSGAYVPSSLADNTPAEDVTSGPPSCQCQFRCKRSVEPREVVYLSTSDRCHPQDETFVSRANEVCKNHGVSGNWGIAPNSSCHFGPR